jgi:hypothetical protein
VSDLTTNSACIELQQDPNAVIPPQYEGLVSHDDYEDVRTYVKEWSAIIRGRLAAKTGLSLTLGRAGLSQSVSAEVPDPVASLIEILTSPLLMFKMRKRRLDDGSRIDREIGDFLDHFPSVARAAGLTNEDEATLKKHYQLFRRLSEFCDSIGFRERFTAIDEDVLGSHRPATREVSLYWIPLAIFSRAAGIDLEQLTKVVLIHEYAHAFTHIGLDINRRQWETRHFLQADRVLTEGLAQFYTAELTLEMRRPDDPEDVMDAYCAYEELLAHQSATYHAHLRWMRGETRLLSEAVRFSLLEARADPHLSKFSSFSDCLARNLSRLRGAD